MFINSTLHGACEAPFYDASLFPLEGGFIGGRLCLRQTPSLDAPICCLPCPATYWAYSDKLETASTVSGWLNVIGLALQVFMLISYTVLPAAKTRSHYLTICLIIAVAFINLAFVIPLGAQPDQCYNGITPNDMYSSLTCAWSGAFLLAGALTGSSWILIRALSMHLQVCWDIIPGRKFFYISQAAGWGIPAALFAAAISISSVSFRFGNSCHINHEDSMATFWGWLLAIAGAALITQLSTFGYCLNVFIRSLRETDDRPSTKSSMDSLPISSPSVKSQKARAIYHRLKSVLYLQWRGILIVTIVLVDVVFFAVVFVYLDNLEASALTDNTPIRPWLACLVLSGGDRNTCLSLSQEWLVSEPSITGMLIMISLVGIELFLLLFRWSLLKAWKEKLFGNRANEFVSFDAHHQASRTSTPASPAKFEMRSIGGGPIRQDSLHRDSDVKSVESSVANTFSEPSTRLLAVSAPRSPRTVYSPKRPNEHGRFGRPPIRTRNFSNPSPGMSDKLGWDPSFTFAKGGSRHMATPSLPLPTKTFEQPEPELGVERIQF